jgi:dTDP-4-amino-4,6-dideoxygalactose transaminase
MNKIKFLDLNTYHTNIEEKIIYSLKKNVFNDTSFINGKSVTNFENNFAEYIGVKHCIGVGNGTDALEIALEALGISEGDEVITQANTFISTVFAIKSVKAKPILVDCDNNFMMDVEQIESKITLKTKCIIPVHMYGHAANMDTIMNIAKKYNLFVIEDCAQSHGAKYGDKCLGSFGDFGCFSFYPGKNLGAYGDGGAIVTNSYSLNSLVRKIANIGSSVKYNHEIYGRNSRLDSIQAEILNIKLQDLNIRNKKRKFIASIYDELLKDIDGIEINNIPKKSTSVYHLYVIRSNKRDELKKYLEDNGVETGIHYPIPLHKSQALYKELGELKYPCTEKYSNEILSLPMYPELKRNEQQFICSLIRMFPKQSIKIDLTTISFFGDNTERKKLTEKFLSYVKYLQDELYKCAIRLSLTFVASDGINSKNMYDKYFKDINNSSYVEYRQQPKYRKNANFLAMLNQKLGIAISKSFEKKCNFSVITGSNDFYSKEFFIQLAKKYNPIIRQIFTLNVMNSFECKIENDIINDLYSNVSNVNKTFRIQCINDKLIMDNNFIQLVNSDGKKYGEYNLANIASNYGAIKEDIYDSLHFDIKSDFDINKIMSNKKKELDLICKKDIEIFNNSYKCCEDYEDVSTWIHLDYVTISYYGDNITRKILTEKFLKYVIYLKNILKKHKIKLTLTFIGSDGLDSRELYKKYFSDSIDSDDTYIEYYQKSFTKQNKEFFYMLHDKCFTAIKTSANKKPHLTVFSGSNDYFSEEFFIQISEKYDSNNKQFFGINETDIKNNIYNFTYVFPVDNDTKIIKNSQNVLLTQSSDMKLKPFYSKIHKKIIPNNYISNICVFNNVLLNDMNFLEILKKSNLTYNEYHLYFMAHNYEAQCMLVNNIFHLNPKCGFDITTFNIITKAYKSTILKVDISEKIPSDLYKIFKRDIDLFETFYKI